MRCTSQEPTREIRRLYRNAATGLDIELGSWHLDTLIHAKKLSDRLRDRCQTPKDPEAERSDLESKSTGHEELPTPAGSCAEAAGAGPGGLAESCGS